MSIKMPLFHFRGLGFIPGHGTTIFHAMYAAWPEKEKKKAFKKDILVSGPEILNYGRMSAPEIIP